MPEGDSVYQLAHKLQFMVGRQVLASSIRVPRYATTSFDGLTCIRVWPYGKNLFMQFDEKILHTHLRMEGSWAMHLVGDRWAHSGHTARVVLQLSAPERPYPIELVGHQLGFVRVFPAAEYPRHIARFGPDVLGEDWEETGRAAARSLLLKEPHRRIGIALLDQSIVAGVGNEYRAEICFLAGIHPAATVGSVDIDRVLDLARQLLWENRYSPLRVTTGVRRIGESTFVYGREGKLCHHCGDTIAMAALAEPDRLAEQSRLIWWCPTCQPQPDL